MLKFGEFKSKVLISSGVTCLVAMLFLFGCAWGEVSAQGIPNRVISLSPNFTQIIYDIGAQDQLVGVTDYCKFPPQARLKEKVGGYFNPNLEKIVSLRPDLILVAQSTGNNDEKFRKLHLPFLVLKWTTVQDVLNLYDVIGEKLGRPAQAGKAKARLEKRLAALRNKKPASSSLSVLFVVDHSAGSLQQIFGAGPNNFINEIIQWTGGRNILEDSINAYPLVSIEAISGRNPDVIISVLPSSKEKSEAVQRELKIWEKLSWLKAVQKRHVFCLVGDDFTVPGPTMLHLAEILSDAFKRVKKSSE